MMIVKARVRRDGELAEIPAEELVPGDIVVVEAGDLVPADGRHPHGGHARDRRGGADRREPAGRRRHVDAGRGRRRAARRPDRHGVHEHERDPRLRASSSSPRPGWRPRSATSPGCSRSTRTSETPLTRQLNTLTNQLLVIAGLALLASIVDRLLRPRRRRSTRCSSRAIAFAVVGDPDRPAGGRHDDPVARHADAGQGRRDREAAALGRDARLDVGDQLRQDRHADAQPDDRRRAGDPRPPLHDLRHGLRDRGQHRARRRRAGRRRSTRSCCRWCSPPTPWSRTAS